MILQKHKEYHSPIYLLGYVKRKKIANHESATLTNR